MSKTALFLCAMLFAAAPKAAGQTGFFIAEGQKQVDIPFEYSNNFIILTLNFNGIIPLKFIFDSGAEHTILSKREISDLLHVTYEREFRVTGSDMKTELVAYLARNIRFDIPGKAVAPREDILVLQEDYFRFEEYAGINIHGILSANAFSKYIIRINYDRRVLTLYDRESYKLRERGFEPLPVEIFRNKIYLYTQLRVLRDSVAPVKLLLDTGAGLTLLLFSDTHPLVHPPQNAVSTNIGMGLGGYLEGFTGRIQQLDLGKFSQKSVVTYFQTLDSTLNPEYLNNRNGLIGNGILSRFLVLIDYHNETIWLKPARDFKEAFIYDRSGLNIIATGNNFSMFMVQNVLPGSPAAEADVRRGDQIVRIGLISASFMSLTDIQRLLQKKAGKKLKIIIKRDGKRIKKTIVLRDLI